MGRLIQTDPLRAIAPMDQAGFELWGWNSHWRIRQSPAPSDFETVRWWSGRGLLRPGSMGPGGWLGSNTPGFALSKRNRTTDEHAFVMVGSK
jgi:hypothetical protein